jgi:MiaB-like tRNA modifying enzyme
MKTVAFHTLGCKVNTYESEAMKKLFIQDDYEVVDFKECADVYVINTCTVTNTGDAKSRQMIRRAIRTNPLACVVVVGCYSQVASQEIEAIEGVGVILGTQHRNRIVEYVKQYNATHQPINVVENIMQTQRFEDLKVASFSENTRAFLKIQDGCNNFCTYCIIPYARGLVRSRPKQSVIEEARALVVNGFVEIVLTGIHTAGYGLDLEDYNFVDLLKDLCHEVKGLKRLRISSIETSQISEEMMALLAQENIIVEHLHIPLQSGCDSVLKRMNRKYTTQAYLEKVKRIRELMPDIALTTDVIVGFPQESEEEFATTVNFIQEVGYSSLHVFPYSQRRNTPAAKMSGQIPENIKQKRVHTLLDLSQQLHQQYASRFIGRVVEVIFEEVASDGELMGYADNYLKVKAHGPKSWIGEITKIQIEEYQAPYCLGKAV